MADSHIDDKLNEFDSRQICASNQLLSHAEQLAARSNPGLLDRIVAQYNCVVAEYGKYKHARDARFNVDIGDYLVNAARIAIGREPRPYESVSRDNLLVNSYFCTSGKNLLKTCNLPKGLNDSSLDKK